MRRLLFFLGYFFVWYGGGFLLYLGYSLTNQDIFPKLGPLFLILTTFLFAYVYFRHAMNDWKDRLLTAFIWTVLTILFTTLLIQPVYGFPWREFLSNNLYFLHWLTAASVLAAGVAAHRKQII